ncbi:hypothetical protein C8Q72DRAFT_770789 [Fomitopsis betulina]|nr:hypothetical protein C8Q72DRAFT_770789 [Fomitopsis betulina]
MLPAIPHTQGLTSTTFCVPPLDGSLALPELFDFHGQHSANHPFFVYAEEDGTTVKSITWARSIQAILRSALLVREQLGWQPNVGAEKAPVVAILSASDAIPYATTVMGIMRAGYVPFPISTRNSPAGVAHLLEKTGAKHLIVGLDPAMQSLAADAIQTLKSQHPSVTVLTTSQMPVFGDLYSEHLGPVEVDVPYEKPSPQQLVFLLHSSGSTAFPKPIPFTHRSLLQIVRAPHYGECDLTGMVICLHGMPMFHALGIIITFFGVSCGKVLALPAPKTPPTTPTPDSTIRDAITTNADIILTVPAVAWSYNPEHVQSLVGRHGVAYGGGPLNKERGDFLVSHGVKIFNLLGSTEGGALSVIFPAGGDSDWDYFRFGSFLTIKLEHHEDNQFEPIIVENEFLRPNVINTKVDGLDAFATSDLVTSHPTRKGLYKIVGRSDEQIMHSTGEKTNPGPLETTMKQDPHVRACVMFGRGRLQVGVIIEPKPEYSFDPSDEVKLAEFRNKVWPTVLKMNAFAPQHSRLFKEMILVAKPDKPFSYTAKRTVRRGVVTKDYEDEINALYDSVDESSQSVVPLPTSWDIASAAEFVRRVVAQVMGRTVPDEGDLFQNGCDRRVLLGNLQATYIRNTLLRAVRETTKIDARHVPEGFVYHNPTIVQLASFIFSTALGNGLPNDGGYPTAGRIDAMRAMVAKYTYDFPVHKPDPSVRRTKGDVVLVTGTTGSLGCHLLSQLFANDEVERIYALNRPSRDQLPLRERQRSALIDRGLDAGVLDSEKVVLLEGEIVEPRFGMGEKVYEELRQSVTHIIHNAWRVDFVITLNSFEPQVQGVRALIDFALTSPLPEPPRLVFESSMGTLQSAPPEEFNAEESSNPEYALGTGYAESKWVSEQVLFTAAATTPLDPLVARVGQVSGGPDGTWNAHEWFPSLVQSSVPLGCFPDDVNVNWIPLDLATAALVEFRKSSSPTHIVHLVHPRPVAWHALAAAIAAELNVPLTPYAVWLAKLEQYAAQSLAGTSAAAPPVQSLRALHLLPMFRGMGEKAGRGRRALGMADMDVERAKAASPTLADPELRQLGAGDAHAWLAYWRKVGLFFEAA